MADNGHKIILIGNSQVGKTCFLQQYCDRDFNVNSGTTIGVDFRFSMIVLDGKTYKMQIWDTAGQERFRTITTSYYRDADGIIVIYDVTSEETFLQVENWFNEINKHSSQSVFSILVGNKKDLENDRVVSTENGQQLAEKLSVPFIETSAKTGENVYETFKQLMEKVITIKKTTKKKTTKKKTVKLKHGDKKKIKCC
ncbi:ras and ef-hand domain-containing protein [Anaeramoeba flamelloides]|uniref:Ras and ef-hand domain-containing protein n=1 Tax=Anaeramoeba flamelloides TaxID=1746091 RepID=A0AAV7ZY03_9EUKA|nr:ras and ef-hand domain-containing protein [Anaeramoeba flamelloides]KAJ6243117.1 ras and ef-hand domain-containing protein [Anaeramoeba flamelloides]